MNQKAPLPPEPGPESDYDQWFREQVEAAIIEADDPNCEWIPHEVVIGKMAAERKRLQALIAAGYINDADLERERGSQSSGGNPENSPT